MHELPAPLSNVDTPHSIDVYSIDEPVSIALQKKDRHFLSTTQLMSLWRYALLPYLSTRFILLIVGLLANFYLMPLIIANPVLPSHATYMQFPQALWLMWQRFDSGYYLSLARHGYGPASTLHNHANWVFYPLYPMLIAGVGFVFGGSSTAFSLAGLLVANLAAIIAIVYFYLLVNNEYGQKVAARAVLYLSLFPMSFYLSAIYTEALFLALALACIYHARRRSWWIAGLCGGLAALTRSQGIALIVPVAWEYLRVTSERYVPLPAQWPPRLSERGRLWLRSYWQGLWRAAHDLQNWLTGLALCLIPAGLFAFMLYAWIKTGDLLATFHADAWGWGRQLAYPWRLLLYSLRHPSVGDPLNWNFWLLNIVLAFIFLGFTVWAFRRLPAIYALYTAVMVLLPLSANLLNSIGRLYLVVFPAFILLALPNRKHEQPWHTFIITVFAALLALFMAFFVIGMPAIA